MLVYFLGLFGFLVLGFLQIPFYFIRAGPPVTENIGDRLEDAIDAFVQIGHSWRLGMAVSGKSHANIKILWFFIKS